MRRLKFTIIVLLLSGFCFPLAGLPQTNTNHLTSPVFNKIDHNNGLSQGTINAIGQDQMGFIWIGTNDGLNRFDGYEMKIFRNNTDDPSSISSNEITSILADDYGYLWIGTKMGLNQLELSTGKFKQIVYEELDESSSITSLAIDNNEHLWIATKNKGLFRLYLPENTIKVFARKNDTKLLPDKIRYLFADSRNYIWISFESGDLAYIDDKEKLHHLNLDYLDPQEKINNRITGICEDSKHNLWISSYGRSLLFLDPTLLKLKQLNHYRDTKNHLPYVLSAIAIQYDSLLWIGTDMDGLGLYNIYTEEIRNFPEGINNILYRTVKTLFTDRDGNLWIGTNGKGLNILSPQSKNFSVINTSLPEGGKLRFSSIRSIYQDDQQTLWLGGYPGFQEIDLQTMKTRTYFDIIPYTICEDMANENILWIGTEGAGIKRYNKISGELSEFPNWSKLTRKNGNNPTIPGKYIFKIINLDDKNLLVGSELGLHILNKRTKDYKLFEYDPEDSHSIIPGDINNIHIDKEGGFWISSLQGKLGRFFPDKETFESIDIKTDEFDIEFSRINCIFSDEENKLWLGTNYGLIELDSNNKIKTVYTETNGLPNNTIYAILDDADGNFWLSTNMGLARLNVNSKEIKCFDINNGLPSNEFNSAAYYKYSDHLFYFGGVDGLVYFDPKNVKTAPLPSSVVVTEAEILGNEHYTDYAISYTNKITLSPDQEILKLNFSAMQFSGFIKENFAFRLDNNTQNWIYLDDDRTLTLSLYEPGSHKLEIIADNGNNEWIATPTQVEIYHEPEFYQTTFFKITIILLIVALIIVVYLIRVNIITQQRNKLEKLVEQRTIQLKNTNEELEVANESKNKFFSIIAHDLKSPFNALLGFSDMLNNNWKALSENEKTEIIQLLKNTTEDTYQLLINLLEWSRLQLKQIKLSHVKINLKILVDDTIKLLNTDAFLKNIRIINNIEEDCTLSGDQNMLLSVLRNLISNAIKFTPKNGKITISAIEKEDETEVCVKDSGVGMTKEEAENLFKLHYRNSTRGTEGESGTGLGLVLCHEFIKKHNGKFKVESSPGNGSLFCFSIPNQKK